MPTIVTADWHLSDNPRDRYRFEFLPWLHQTVQENKVDHLLLLGDLTESKDRHGAWLVNRIVDEMTKLAAVCPMTIVCGNHDYVMAEAPFFLFLRRIKNIRWVNRPSGAVNALHDGLKGLGRSLLLPHTSDWKKDWDDLDFGYYDWVFCHQSFTGADVGSGHRVNDIPVSVFPRDAKVVAGDVHLPQVVGPVTYVGAPYTVDFGDDYQPRVLLLEGDQMQSIDYHGPMKRLVELYSLDELDKVEVVTKDIVKVRFTLTAANYDQWPTIREQLTKWAASRSVYLQLQPKVEGKVIRKDRKTLPTRSDKELLQAYAKQRRIDDRTLKTGLLLLQ